MNGQKKQRKVRNSYIDIDSVTIEPGINYCDWISITKAKLKEREHQLLDIKILEIQCIVNNVFNISDKTHFVVTEKIRSSTLKQLYYIINSWNGVDLTRTKSSLQRYRDYFCIGKNWWDQTKKRIFGGIFWLIIFKHIEQCVGKNRLLDQLNIIKALFNGSVKYHNTKIQPLINGGTVMCSHQIHQYLFGLHNGLNIKQWIKEQKSDENVKQKSKTLIYKIRAELGAITNTMLTSGISAINHNSSGTLNNVTSNNMNNKNRQQPLQINNNNNNNNNNRQQPLQINNNYNNYNNNTIYTNINNNSYGHYGGYHGASYTASDLRYTPILSVPVIVIQQNPDLPLNSTNNNNILLLNMQPNNNMISLLMPANTNIISFQQ